MGSDDLTSQHGFSKPTSAHSSVTYLTKYITKSEPRSVGADSVLNIDKMQLIARVTSTLRSYVLNYVCGNRDMGKEEACRIILGEAGKKYNVNFIAISFNSVRLQQNILNRFGKEEVYSKN